MKRGGEAREERLSVRWRQTKRQLRPRLKSDRTSEREACRRLAVDGHRSPKSYSDLVPRDGRKQKYYTVSSLSFLVSWDRDLDLALNCREYEVTKIDLIGIWWRWTSSHQRLIYGIQVVLMRRSSVDKPETTSILDFGIEEFNRVSKLACRRVQVWERIVDVTRSRDVVIKIHNRNHHHRHNNDVHV